MLGFTQKPTKIPGVTGTNHDLSRSLYSPFDTNPSGMLKGMGMVDMFNPSSKNASDNASSSNMLDRSRVYNKIVAKVGRNDSDHFYKEHDILFAWNGEATISSEKRSIYQVLTLSGTNNRIKEIQEPRFVAMTEESAGGVRKYYSSSSSASMNDAINMFGPNLNKNNLMSLKTLYHLIDLLGLPLHEITPGSRPSIDIARNVGGVSFTINYEGRSEIGNLWDDNSSGSHVTVALNKSPYIKIDNPFHPRFHRLEPCTSRTSTGIPWYERYGVFAISDNRKRERGDFYISHSSKYARGSESNSMKTIGYYSSASSSSSHSGKKYRRHSLIINCEELNKKTVTGTVYSLMRHEKTLCDSAKENHCHASKVPNTFLDWSVGQFDVSKSISTGSRLMQSKEVYGVRLWRIVRHQSAVYKLGVVLTSQRGGIPDQKLVDSAVYEDHNNAGEAMQTLNTNNKLTIHMRSQ